MFESLKAAKYEWHITSIESAEGLIMEKLMEVYGDPENYTKDNIVYLIRNFEKVIPLVEKHLSKIPLKYRHQILEQKLLALKELLSTHKKLLDMSIDDMKKAMLISRVQVLKNSLA